MIYDRKLHASKPALPEGYEKAFTIDLQSDKKTYLIVNLSALAVAAVLFLIGCLVTPFRALYADGSISVLLLRAGVLIVGSVAYIILHELVHGITMRYYGSNTVKYGFTGSYAYAGSSDFYDRASYIVITLAPVVFWGIVLLILCLVLPASWFWVAYMIQIFNISGAAGDAYVTFRLIRSPRDILISDSGVKMEVYRRTEE